jgi:hypothetical protein
MISHSEASAPGVIPAAYDSPAEKAFAPEPESLADTRGNVLARAEHEQEIGWLERRADQMPRIDRGDFGLARQAVGSIPHIALDLSVETTSPNCRDPAAPRSHISLRLIAVAWRTGCSSLSPPTDAISG